MPFLHNWGFNLHIRETNQAVVCAPVCPSALSAASHQSRALTNFGKPGRDRLHGASLCAVKQPTWSCSVSSPFQKHDAEKWRKRCRGTGRLDTLFSPYWRGLFSLSRKWFWQPPNFCVFSLSCSPINKSLCKAVRVHLHWCEWVCGSFSISWVIMKCSMLVEVIKNTQFYKKEHAVDSQQLFPPIMNICVSFPVKRLITVSLSVLAQRRDTDMSVPNNSAHLLFLPSSDCSVSWLLLDFFTSLYY